jgi:signal transduction histidine kinase
MSAETQKRIFEPFYTTKGDVGTGLGLWVTAGIVEKHNGSLRVRSSVRPQASGSAFTLLLPYPAGTPQPDVIEAHTRVPAESH